LVVVVSSTWQVHLHSGSIHFEYVKRGKHHPRLNCIICCFPATDIVCFSSLLFSFVDLPTTGTLVFINFCITVYCYHQLLFCTVVKTKSNNTQKKMVTPKRTTRDRTQTNFFGKDQEQQPETSKKQSSTTISVKTSKPKKMSSRNNGSAPPPLPAIDRPTTAAMLHQGGAVAAVIREEEVRAKLAKFDTMKSNTKRAFKKAIEGSINKHHECWEDLQTLNKNGSKKDDKSKSDLQKSIGFLKLKFPVEYKKAGMETFEVFWNMASTVPKDRVVSLKLAVVENSKVKTDQIHHDSRANRKLKAKCSTAPEKERLNSPSEKAHIQKLHVGDTSDVSYNCIEAIPGIPKSIAFLITPLPVQVMAFFQHQYGSDEYTRHFATYSKSITIGRQDSLSCAEYAKDVNGATPPTEKEAAFLEKELFDLAVLQNAEEEAHLINNPFGTPFVAQELGGYFDLKEYLSETGIPEGDLKPKAKTATDNPNPFLIDQHWPNFIMMTQGFKDKGISPGFLVKPRTSYMMDGWFVLADADKPKDEGEKKKEKGCTYRDGDDTITPHMLHKRDKTSQDSRCLNAMGVTANLCLRDLVGLCLGKVFAEEYPEDVHTEYAVVEDSSTTTTNQATETTFDAQTTAPPSQNSTYSKVFSINNLGKLGKSIQTYLDGGIIKTGTTAILQSLHIDNKDIMDNEVALRIWNNEKVKPLDLLRLGYVIDMPLSDEGEWIRVAYPDPDNPTVFIIDWLFVPNGCALVRNDALFHGGHSGNPGNSRYHATFTIKDGIEVDTKYLGYFTDFAKKEAFKDFRLRWHDSLLGDTLKTSADGYRWIMQRWSALKSQGTKYFSKQMMSLSAEVHVCLYFNLNPSILMKSWVLYCLTHVKNAKNRGKEPSLQNNNNNDGPGSNNNQSEEDSDPDDFEDDAANGGDASGGGSQQQPSTGGNSAGGDNNNEGDVQNKSFDYEDQLSASGLQDDTDFAASLFANTAGHGDFLPISSHPSSKKQKTYHSTPSSKMALILDQAEIEYGPNNEHSGVL
jgi:hypothetical protein